MSALRAVLPMVWGFAPAAPSLPGERKGPARLALVGGPSLAEAAAALRMVAEAPSIEKVAAARSESANPGGPAFYRKYTEGMLRRYVKLSMEAGKTPSLLGQQEMFRGQVTSYQVRSFDDVVIFVHDVGQCVAILDSGQQHLIRRIALQEYTQGETAAMMRVSLRTINRRYAEAIDCLTGLFLRRGLLKPLTACQGG